MSTRRLVLIDSGWEVSIGASSQVSIGASSQVSINEVEVSIDDVRLFLRIKRFKHAGYENISCFSMLLLVPLDMHLENNEFFFVSN